MTRPRYADDTTQLCELAAHLLAERVAKYPAAVAAGRIGQAEADDAIRVMRAVAARWTMIPLRDLAQVRSDELASVAEMHATLVKASARTAQIAAVDPSNADKANYAAAVAALLWHAEQWRSTPRPVPMCLNAQAA